MHLPRALTGVFAAFRRRPSDLLPFYVIGASVPAIARIAVFAGLAVAYVYLDVTSRIEATQAELAGIGSPPDPASEPEAFDAWVEGLIPALTEVFTPGVVLLLVASVLAMVAIMVVLYPVVSAGQFATCRARLESERGTLAGIAGVRDHWLQFIGLLILELLLWAVVTVVVAIVAIPIAVAVGLADPVLVVLVVLLVFVPWLLAILAIRAVFAFAPVALIVDETTVFGSIRATGGYLRANPFDALVYFVVAAGATGAISSASGVLFVVGADAILAVVSVLLVIPALDLFKTGLYMGHRGTLAPPSAPEITRRSQFLAGIRRGWREMVGFVRATPGIHAVVVGLGVGSFVVGWWVAGPYETAFPASIGARIEGMIPPAAALNFFGNNWLVALTTAFSGVALAIPAIVSILFNGVFIGGIARLEEEPIELLAFVVPHGIFEIPAIFVAGSVGVVLGVAYWRALRGRLTRTEFADELERAFWVLVGVGILLAVAGFVEGFISPYYWRPFL